MSEGPHDDALVSATSDADGIEIFRIFEASPEKVFEAWTRPEGFAAWFGEHGSSIPLDRASMDPRPGGAWQAVMLVGDDIEVVFAGNFLEVEPPHHLVMTVADRIPTADDPVDVMTVDLRTSATAGPRWSSVSGAALCPPTSTPGRCAGGSSSSSALAST